MRCYTQNGCCFLLFVALLSTWAIAPTSGASSAAIHWTALREVDDQPLDLEGSQWKVICFLGVECPLARLYGQRLSELSDEYASQGVRVIGINSNPQDSREDVQGYIADLGITFPIVKDSDQQIAHSLGATRTAEVMVLDTNGELRYHGRIDDQYEPGIARAKATRHVLRDAVEALVAGKQVPIEKTKPQGCLITFVEPAPEMPTQETSLTFSRDIAPILNKHCVECHRPGEIGPFSLIEYDEVLGWGEMMLEVIHEKRMPPWHADPEFGKFVGERHIPVEDVEKLAEWVAGGMPEGDPQDLPPLPEWTAGWQLSTPPDEQFAMRGRPFQVPADGIVEYQYFVVDPGWEEDRWIHAAQVVPGNASVVHHAIVFVREPDGRDTRGIGWLGGYVPGQRVLEMPAGHARLIPAGSKLVFQMHYTPIGRETEDVTKVGVWLIDEEDVTHEVSTRVALNHDFEIPPGEESHTVDLRMRWFTRGSTLLGASPHMHLRGRSFRLAAKREDQLKTLLNVPNYDFNWQHLYGFQTPLPLDDVASLEMQITFDNSAENPTNPDPSQFVTWGDQTWQEMAVAFFDVAHPRGERREVVRHESDEATETTEQREARIADLADDFFAKMDTDGDGVILREEVPESFRLFGFRQFDEDRDGRLQREEIEEKAARRL